MTRLIKIKNSENNRFRKKKSLKSQESQMVFEILINNTKYFRVPLTVVNRQE